MDQREKNECYDDYSILMSDTPTMEPACMRRDWPENRGTCFNTDKTFLVCVNVSDALTIVAVEKSSDIRGVFTRLTR